MATCRTTAVELLDAVGLHFDFNTVEVPGYARKQDALDHLQVNVAHLLETSPRYSQSPRQILRLQVRQLVRA